MRQINNFDYRPAPFWFLNHNLEKSEIKRQIDLMTAADISGFFIHPRAGLLTPYGSEKWFEIINYIMDVTHELQGEDILLWLAHDGYDYPFEDNYTEQWNYLVEGLQESDTRSLEVKMLPNRLH